MAKYRTLKPRKFTVELRDWRQASAHGGQLAVAALLEQFGLKERVAGERALDPRTHRGKGYTPLVYVTQVLFSLTSGGVSLADAEPLNDDGPLLAFLGMEKFPDPTALGEWLRDIGEAGGQALRRLNRDFVQWAFQRAEPARYRHAGRTEAFFDDTQIEVNGSSFEGAAMNYEGNLALSWQVLLVGPFVADQILGATSGTKESPASDQAGKDVSSRLPELLAANASLWEREQSYLYTDSASSAGKYLECIARHFGAWSVSYNKWTGPLEAKAAELPEQAWSPVQPVKWRDGSEHAAQYAWFRYQPGGCETPQRFAVVRHRPAGEMFWRYAFLTAQEQEGSAQLAFERHRLKGDKERVLSELLSDLDLHHPPCANLNANRSFYTLAVLAWNLLQALKLLHLPETEAPKRMRTLLRHLLLIPVELKRHARSLKACLYAPAGWVAWTLERVVTALPCGASGDGERVRLKQKTAEPDRLIASQRENTLAKGVPRSERALAVECEPRRELWMADLTLAASAKAPEAVGALP